MATEGIEYPSLRGFGCLKARSIHDKGLNFMLDINLAQPSSFIYSSIHCKKKLYLYTHTSYDTISKYTIFKLLESTTITIGVVYIIGHQVFSQIMANSSENLCKTKKLAH